MSASNRRDDEPNAATYWSEQMDQAWQFMEAMRVYPVRECGEPLISLVEAANAARVEVLFTEQKHVEGRSRLFYLRQGQIADFIAAAHAMNERGWVMRVEDGFRTREMQSFGWKSPLVFDAIVQKTIWECGTVPEPDLIFRRLSALIATMPKIGTHMSGSAIDISVFSAAAGEEIDRGGPYLEMSERTPMTSPFVSPSAMQNRCAIRDLMRRHRFMDYPWEFWHFSSGDCYGQFFSKVSEPARYGAIDWDQRTNQIQPIENPCEPLISMQEMTARVEESLKRLTQART